MAWTIGIVLGGITALWVAWNLTLDALWPWGSIPSAVRSRSAEFTAIEGGVDEHG